MNPAFDFSWHPGCVAQRVQHNFWEQKKHLRIKTALYKISFSLKTGSIHTSKQFRALH